MKNEHIYKQIVDDLKQVPNGILTITVHASEITQVDVTKKQRFDKEKSGNHEVQS